MQEVISINKILHLVEARFGFCHFTCQLVDIRIEFTIIVHIGINFKNSPGQLVVRIIGVHLYGFGGTFDDLVFNGDFDGLSVLGDFYREDFFRQYEGFRRCDFTHEEVSSRHIIKLKVPDFIALGDHEGGFFGKLRFVKTEQADNSAA